MQMSLSVGFLTISAGLSGKDFAFSPESVWITNHLIHNYQAKTSHRAHIRALEQLIAMRFILIIEHKELV